MHCQKVICADVESAESALSDIICMAGDRLRYVNVSSSGIIFVYSSLGREALIFVSRFYLDLDMLKLCI